MNFEDVKGLTFTSIDVEDDVIRFTTDTGRKFKMYHDQDCCESVYVESVVGDIDDLLNTPILVAEEAESNDVPSDVTYKYEPESQTWTFYKLATRKGYVDIRWLGESNGYYSESVNFREV